MLDDNEKPCGSMLVLEADNLADVRALAEADPYWTEGVFGSIEVSATNLFLGRLASQDD